jgi:SpoVK/Ycf46/Vps4 family AAA+-type ATPase
VGESEGRLRKALNTIDSLGPCIVLVDEIEKALAGATQGAADGGVSADALGTFLSWMNDRTSQAFVIATANDISSITTNAPELLRKGRFDEIFFVDTPNAQERVQVVAATLKTFKREPDGIDLQAIARRTDTFTGAELASLVPEALFTAFADGERALTTADLLQAAEGIVPLAQTASEKIASLRNWAKTRARAATTADKKVAEAPAQVLDID